MSISTILVVEDNILQQFALQALLAKFDYYAYMVSSGEEAIAALELETYSAILMDLHLPGMDGLECTRRIRQMELKSGKRTPVIALTASTNQCDIDAFPAAGMDGYISKPFDPEDLRKMLLRFVYDAAQPKLKTLRPLPLEDGDVELSA